MHRWLFSYNRYQISCLYRHINSSLYGHVCFYKAQYDLIWVSSPSDDRVNNPEYLDAERSAFLNYRDKNRSRIAILSDVHI